MPLPFPEKEEQKSEFISRCVSDKVMITEFPNVAQRIAVCQTQFAKPKKEKNKQTKK
jgi:hypothetical protein